MIKFGTGGWRAVIGDEFTFSNIRTVAQAVAIDITNKGLADRPVVIGYDNRFMSDTAANLCAEVLAGNNIQSSIIKKQSPTPLIMYTVKNHNASYGLAITASHNPAEYNGIKLIVPPGMDAKNEDTLRIENIIKDITQIKYISLDKGIETEIIKYINPFNEYIDTILSAIDVESIRKSNLSIVLDTMYGVCKSTLLTILTTARCDVQVIHDYHDALFGGRLPAPSIDTLLKLQRKTIESKADIGIATDGDADRLGIISSSGQYIHANDIMAILYYYLLKYKGWKGPIVRNIATTHILDKIAQSFGEECYEVPVGFKYISSKMEETNALIGGESSGGLTIRGHIKGKDGIFAASLLVEALCVTGKSIDELLDTIHKIYGNNAFVESNYKFSINKKDYLLDKIYVKKEIPDFNISIKDVSYADGVKIYFSNGGWVSARFSGTEPLLRIYSEMENETDANSVINKFKQMLNI